MISLTGSDLLVLNGRSLVDFANGDNFTITFGNDISNTAIGKNGNAVIAKNEMGKLAELTVRLLRGSPDDKFMLNIVNTYFQDSSSFVVMTGSATKRVGDGTGSVSDDIYSLEAGVPSKMPEVKSNVEGDVEQAIAIYTMRFVATRVLS